jgi:hypothetical protein
MRHRSAQSRQPAPGDALTHLYQRFADKGTRFLDTSCLTKGIHKFIVQGDRRAHASHIASNDAVFNASEFRRQLAAHQLREEPLVRGAEVGEGH